MKKRNNLTNQSASVCIRLGRKKCTLLAKSALFLSPHGVSVVLYQICFGVLVSGIIFHFFKTHKIPDKQFIFIFLRILI